MRKARMLLGITGMLVAIAASDARAAGPICFSTLPFEDVLVWFVDTTGGNQFAGSGRDLSGDRAQTVTGFVSGTTVTFGFTTYSKDADTAPVTGGGTIDLATGSGPAACFAPDFVACGDFTLTAITCPAGATTDTKAGGPAGRVQGASP